MLQERGRRPCCPSCRRPGRPAWAPAPPARPASGRWPARAGRVVAAVEPQLGARREEARQRAVVEPLHARRPAHARRPRSMASIGEPERFQLQRRGDRRCRRCRSGAGRSAPAAAGPAAAPRSGRRGGRAARRPRSPRPTPTSGADRPGARADHLQRLGRLPGDDGGDAALEDAGLLARRSRPAVSPSLSAWSRETGVMTLSAGRGDDVGGVEPAAEPDLQDQRHRRDARRRPGRRRRW